MKKKIIIINQTPFGHHSITYYNCKYLKDDYDIIYVCWDHGLPKIEMNCVQVIYVSRKGGVLVRTARFLRQALEQIDNNRKAKVFIKYFKVVSLVLRLLRSRRCFILDIRTGSIHKNSLVRRFKDARLKFEARFFRHVTINTHTLAEKLGIAHKAHILPIGADVISSAEKQFDKLRLLYVGTFFTRNIDVTIHGFKRFYEEFKNRIPISYTIIGTGPGNEEQALKDLVARYGLKKIIRVTGVIPHTELKTWFDTANIGVSYVPLTDYHDCQPITKTFEYLRSGMPVIATNTSEQRKAINRGNGVLVGETAEEFYSGLKTIFDNRTSFDSKEIRTSSMGYSWEKIVQGNLKVYLENLGEK